MAASRPDDLDQLVPRAVQGDPNALEALLYQVLPTIRRKLARYVGQGPDLDDLTQDVLITVARRIETFRGEARLSTWLHTVCARAAYRSSRPRWLGTEALLATLPGSGASAIDGWVTLGQLDSAVEALPHHLRTVFVLCDVEGNSRTEAASILGIAQGTVAYRLRVARRTLQRHLGPGGVR